MSIPGSDIGFIRNVFKTLWWVVLLRGILMVAFGLFMIVWPEPALVAFVWLFGIYAIIDGAASLMHVWRTRSNIGMGVALGVVSVLAGLVALIWPGVTAVAALFLFAAWILLLGVIQLAAGVSVRRIPGSGWGWLAGAGALLVILGFLLFAAPSGGILAILTLVGAITIAAGVALIIAAVYARKFARQIS